MYLISTRYLKTLPTCTAAIYFVLGALPAISTCVALLHIQLNGKVKGIVSHDECFWRLTIINRYPGTFCTCADSLYNVVFLSWWKIKLKILACSLILILPVTRFKDPKAAILTQKLFTRSHVWFVKLSIKYWWKCLDLQEQYRSRDTLPSKG
jgi:hypothetical protein